MTQQIIRQYRGRLESPSARSSPAPGIVNKHEEDTGKINAQIENGITHQFFRRIHQSKKRRAAVMPISVMMTLPMMEKA